MFDRYNRFSMSAMLITRHVNRMICKVKKEKNKQIKRKITKYRGKREFIYIYNSFFNRYLFRDKLIKTI